MILNYKEFGEGSPLFILHGLFGSLDNWQTLAKRFADHYRVFIVDQRNHGHSFHDEKMDYQVMAEDVVALADSLGIDTFHLIGHSMGGKTAMKVAMVYPNRIEKMVVADIGPQEYESKHDKILEALHAVANVENLGSRKEAERVMSGFIQDQGVKYFLLKNLYWKEKGLLAWRMNLPVISDNLDKILASTGTDSISVRTLFLAGGKSDYILEEDHMMLQMQFSNSEVWEMPDVGHWLHAEDPDGFFNSVMRFFEL